MNSMTGYGKGVAAKNGKTVTIEIKTVNHRFLDWNLKFPKSFLYLEDSIKKAVGARISRGHVDLFVTYERTAVDEGAYTVDIELAKNYLLAANQLAEVSGLANDLTLSSLLRVNDIVVRETPVEDEELLRELTLSAVNTALDNLSLMRAKEGVALKADITEKLNGIEKSLNTVIEYAPQVVRDYRQRLDTMLDEVRKSGVVDENRLATEVALFADRCAIDEETSRLGTHIRNMRALLESTEPIGRQLDFLVQEMNREANTTGSKANNLNITNEVLLIKNNIEKIREQAANVE